MPWTVVKEGEEWCVHKENADGTPGEQVACHDSEEGAQAQMRALYAAMHREEGKATVKAVGTDDGEWALDVLGIPYGGPYAGKDSDGEYFSPQTNLHADKYGLPPAVYYHGYDDRGKPSGSPSYIGKTVSREQRSDGWWFRVVLDKSVALARRVWEAAKQGAAAASSGSVAHLIRTATDGHILEWPPVELSLFDVTESRKPANPYAVALPAMKALYAQAGITVPEDYDQETEAPQAAATGEQQRVAAAASGEVTIGKPKVATKRGKPMAENDEVKALTAEDVARIAADAVKADREARDKEAVAKAKQEKAIADAVKAEREKWEQDAAKGRRLPGGGEAPYVAKFDDVSPYDNLDAVDMTYALTVLQGAGIKPNPAAYKAVALKLEEDKTVTGEEGRRAMKAVGVKAAEVNYSTLTSYGTDWATAAMGRTIWESIRRESVIAQNIPSVEVPQGFESLTIPLESTDPVFYKVAQTTADAATGGKSTPAPTVTSSRLGTSSQALTVAKMGARVRWTEELNEDSIIPWANQLRTQLDRAAQEYFDHVVIDGDTATTATTNINDIGGTPAGTEAFLVANGFRKLALVTNTANSRGGGALDEDDFIETAKLLGTGGKNADPARCAFILDPFTSWKAYTEITAIKTRDVFGSPTLEGGRLTSLWGYPVLTSYSMHYVFTYSPHTMSSYPYRAQTNGKIDQDTQADNTTGSLLAVRWDQWMLGWKRRVTMAVTPHPEWDGYEIVTMMRFGLTYRDTEASAITYNITI